MQKFLKIMTVVGLLFCFAGCNNVNNIQTQKYSDENILEFNIRRPGETYFFSYTSDKKIVVHDENKKVLSVSDTDDCQDIIDSYLDNIKNSSKEDIEFDLVVYDFWEVTLSLGKQEYRFVYGASKNPYVNMLIEVIIGFSDCKKAQESLVPYPSTFRIQ